MFFHTKSVPNLDFDLRLRCDGCETVSCVFGSHSRIILGSCSDLFSDHGRIGWRIVNGVWSTDFRACAVDRIPFWFATVGSFPHCKWGLQVVLVRWVAVDRIPLWFATLGSFPRIVNGVASGAGGGVADGVLKEVSHEMRFWEIAHARKPKCFSIQSPSPNLAMIYLCGATVARRSRVWSDHASDHGRIILGSWSDFRRRKCA